MPLPYLTSFVLVCSGFHNKIHRLGGLNNRNLLSRRTGGQKSEIRVPAWSGSGENPLWLADSCLLPMFLCRFSSVGTCRYIYIYFCLSLYLYQSIYLYLCLYLYLSISISLYLYLFISVSRDREMKRE